MGEEVAKYSNWLNKMNRTILSRRIELSEEEMVRHGILGIINYEAIYEDGLSPDQNAGRLINQARNTYIGGSVLVDSAMNGGMGRPYRIYSAIVFRDIGMHHMFILRMPHLYPSAMFAYGLSN